MGINAMPCMILHNCKLVLQRRTHVHILLQNIKKINIYVLLQGAELKRDTAFGATTTIYQ
jgi:hypothetical protein